MGVCILDRFKPIFPFFLTWLLYKLKCLIPMVAGPSGPAVFGRSPAEIVGSNPTGGLDVCLL
jgi:hypothetical protein